MTPMQTAEKVTPASLYTHIHRAKGELGLIKRSRLPQALFRVIQACAQTPILYACVVLAARSADVEGLSVLCPRGSARSSRTGSPCPRSSVRRTPVGAS